MKIIIDTDVDNLLIFHKKKLSQFIFNEILIYFVQIIIFFLVSFLISGSLNNEVKLIKYLDSKINLDSLPEIGYVILSTMTVIGILTSIQKAYSDFSWIDHLIDEVLISISRTIYFFGSSVTGALLGVTVHTYIYSAGNQSTLESLLYTSFIFSATAFIYGCLTNYLFIREKQIIKKPLNKTP